MSWSDELRGTPKPQSDAELEVISAICFGSSLHLKSLYLGGYEVEELYDSYHGKGWKYSQGCIKGYDNSAAFWAHCCGKLSCGGIAGRSYGQFKIAGHRHRARLLKWISSRRRDESRHLRTTFVRLARRYGVGESMGIRGIHAQTTDRVDGAVAVFPESRGWD